MGSLPNLSDLGKEEYGNSAYKLGSVIGHTNYAGHQGILSQEEKNKILHRHSGYNKNTNRVRRFVQPSNIDDLMLESYVVCTLGIHRLNLVFLCMGLLQSIAACTLSMLLRSIRRYYLIAVGFTFHICLLMVQMIWKPISDDPALFYVISAAWGVCNAIWEMLNYTLLTGLYMENWEPAFANSIFFRFLGMGFAFGVHGLLCNWCKVYLLGIFMIVAIVPYGWLEIKLENIRKVKNVSKL
ncbi:hypothetical protein Trydic_g23598 [Trypoxylus dichotomus]